MITLIWLYIEILRLQQLLRLVGNGELFETNPILGLATGPL